MRLPAPARVALLAAAVVAVQLATQASGKGFYLTQLTMTAYYALVVVGLSLLMGYAGQISLGQAGFFAIGGYTAAFVSTVDLSAQASLPAIGAPRPDRAPGGPARSLRRTDTGGEPLGGARAGGVARLRGGLRGGRAGAAAARPLPGHGHAGLRHHRVGGGGGHPAARGGRRHLRRAPLPHPPRGPPRRRGGRPGGELLPGLGARGARHAAPREPGRLPHRPGPAGHPRRRGRGAGHGGGRGPAEGPRSSSWRRPWRRPRACSSPTTWAASAPPRPR